MNYKIIYSNRRTLCIQITREGECVVRAPKKISKDVIESFVTKKQAWIDKSIQKVLQRKEASNQHFLPALTKQTWLQARDFLQKELDTFAKIMSLSYSKFSLSKAKTCWGSCSSKNVIRLHWKLAFFDKEIADYVVIHELAHIPNKNHSPKFWSLVASYCPDYMNIKRKLKNLT